MNGLPKRLLSLCFASGLCLLVSSHSFALPQVGLPTSLCSGGSYQCDSATKKRWSLFQSSDGIKIKQNDYLSIGACSRNGENNNQVFVLLALSQNIDEIYFDAKISFHNDLSDYDDTPASDIHTIFPKIQYDRNLMRTSESHAYIDYSQIAPFRYWIRHNKPEDKLIMVVYFGYLDTFLCEFQPV